MAGTFISYRRDDAAGYAGRLRESLERRLGSTRVFRDVDALQPGQDFVQAIESRLASCGVMLVVIGRDWLDAKMDSGNRRLDDPYDFVRLEVAAGLARSDVLVVPVLVEGASMPAAADLPEDVRPLARRHAVSVRDETWDADVDRLVEVVTGAGRGQDALREHPRQATALKWALAGVALLLAAGLAVWLMRAGSTDATTTAMAQSAAGAPLAAGTAAASAPYAIAIPRIAEVVAGDVVYTLVSGNVTPRGTAAELRLRIRLANDGSSAVNFWDSSFRLSVNGEELAPTSDLNEIVMDHSLRNGVVTFQLPPRARRVVLRILDGRAAADLPLDVTQTGRAATDEQADVADSLSQAIIRPVTGESASIISAGDVRITLDRVTSRRFVNAVRLTVVARIDNRGRYPISSGDFIVRVVAGDDTIAPLTPLGDPVNNMSTLTITQMFDLPPASNRATLRAIYKEHATERVLELQ